MEIDNAPLSLFTIRLESVSAVRHDGTRYQLFRLELQGNRQAPDGPHEVVDLLPIHLDRQQALDLAERLLQVASPVASDTESPSPDRLQ